jgi:hypothetical protein
MGEYVGEFKTTTQKTKRTKLSNTSIARKIKCYLIRLVK